MFHRMAGNVSSSHKAQEFSKGFAWLNTEKPLSMEGLKGHVVVLDFWTYCCINCMHTLPTIDWLEKKYRGQPVVFIGVHSAKFFNEQQAQNVQEAVGRYEIGHPVVVDQEMKIWRSYNVTAWPTIVIVDPKGNVVYQQAG
jgi:thiol-disulfide isomerase/thioredoxin